MRWAIVQMVNCVDGQLFRKHLTAPVPCFWVEDLQVIHGSLPNGIPHIERLFEEHFRRVLAKRFQGILQPDGAIPVVPCLSTAAGPRRISCISSSQLVIDFMIIANGILLRDSARRLVSG